MQVTDIQIGAEHALVEAYWDRRGRAWAGRPMGQRLCWTEWRQRGATFRPPLLDAGCGDGKFLAKLVVAGQKDVYGLDISAELVSLARDGLRGQVDVEKRIRRGDILDLAEAFQVRFATIFCDGVLRFSTFQGARAMMESMCNALDRSGQLFVVLRASEGAPGRGTRVSDRFETYRRADKGGIVTTHFRKEDLGLLVPDGFSIRRWWRGCHQTRSRRKLKDSWCLIISPDTPAASK